MTGKLQFKRGLKANLPTSAPAGTPLWCTDTKELYIGTGDSISKVGSNPIQTDSGEIDLTETLAPYEKINKPVIFPVGIEIDPDTYDEEEEYENSTLAVEIGDIVELWNLYKLTDNSINRIEIEKDSIFRLPEISDNTIFHQILIQLTLSDIYSIDLGTSVYFSGQEPDLSTSGSYNLIYEYDGNDWAVGCVKKG